MKMSTTHWPRERTVSRVAVFPQELALAKPVARDKFAIEQFFDWLLA
jgi:hypothetical protein